MGLYNEVNTILSGLASLAAREAGAEGLGSELLQLLAHIDEQAPACLLLRLCFHDCTIGKANKLRINRQLSLRCPEDSLWRQEQTCHRFMGYT